MAEPIDKEVPVKPAEKDEKARPRTTARADVAETTEATEPEESEEPSEEEEEEEAAEGEESAEAAEEEQPVVENRRERRRKRKRPDADDQPARDRNKRVRDQLMKKRVEAERNASPLTTGEMVDDAFARGVAGAGKWLRQNSALVQYLVLALIVGGVAYGVYSWRTGAKSETSSADLMFGVLADRGRVVAEAPPKKDEEIEVLPTFKTEDQRVTVALAAYKKVETQHPGTGASMLARLGEAGMLLDKHAWEEALAAYREVKASPLGNADPDVRGRAMEGIGFALEGKGDREAAMKAFHELETVQQKGFPELGLYHQARLHWAKGEREPAAAALKMAREKLSANPEEKNLTYLKNVIDDLQRQVDPTAVPKPLPSRGPGAPDKPMSVDDIQKLQEQLRQLQDRAKDETKAPPAPPKSSR